MAVNLQIRADHAIVKRQQQELAHERLVASGAERFAVEQKGLWENRTCDVIRSKRVQQKAAGLEAQQKAKLEERRRRLAQMLSDEQKALEQEMVDREETPQQRMDKMSIKAYELKKRREDERKAFVQEKLYQQWRDGIDELRTMDSKIVELKTIAARDFQLDDRNIKKAEEQEYDDFYAQLWHEGYLAKGEREQREKAMRKERDAAQTKTLGVQLAMKARRMDDEKQEAAAEGHKLKAMWAEHEQEEKDALVRGREHARTERAKADEYMAIQQAQRDREAEIERQQDRAFIDGVLERERHLAEKEEMEKHMAKKKAVEYTEALKVEMMQKAESDALLERLQAEESEKQWQQRYKKWEKEELARRELMEEVYNDRHDQVTLKHQMRKKLKEDIEKERGMIDAEVERLDAIEKEREEGEKMVARRQQEELFRQMDFHQVQRHRQLHQHAIEQRQAAIAEEKIRRAVKAETQTANKIMTGVLEKRKTQAKSQLIPPWER